MPRRKNNAGKKIKRRKGTYGHGHHKFTPRARKLIYKAYEAGIPSAKRICEMVGVEYTTFTHWLDMGKDPEYKAHFAFRQRIMRIQAKKETEMLKCIEMCAVGGFEVKETQVRINPKGKEVRRRTRVAAPAWQAAAWRLERWLPDDYGLKPVNVNSDASADDLAREIQAAYAALDASVPDSEFEEGGD